MVLTETDACCGPMAAAFLGDYSTHIEVVSVGRKPLQAVDSLLVAAMKECLIDLSGYRPRNVEDFDLPDFDVIYECPDLPFPGNLEDFRTLRDYIKNEAYLFFRSKIQSPYPLDSQLKTDN